MRNKLPNSSSSRLVFNSTWATEAIEAKASPRNPIVRIANKSSALLIFEVAWRSKHMIAS